MTEQLLTVAEIAVTLAGFSALVALLTSRRGQRDPRVDALMLRLMLEVSFFVAAFALFPLIPLNFGVDQDASWRISAAAFLVCAVPVSIYGQRRAQSITALFDLSGRRLRAFLTALDIVSYLLLLIAAVGCAGSWTGGFYFAALYANLVLAGLLFIGFAASTFTPPSD